MEQKIKINQEAEGDQILVVKKGHVRIVKQTTQQKPQICKVGDICEVRRGGF